MNRKTYVTGFIYSIILTMAAYFLVVNQILKGWFLLFAIILLAVIQLIVQLYFFLHLNQEEKPRLNLQAFIFAAGVVAIIVFGSLWIMTNLSKYHGHHRTPDETNKYIQDEELIDGQTLR